MRLSNAIRATAWGVVAAGVAAPLVRKRIAAPPLVTQTVAFAAPLGLCVAVRRSRTRDVAVCSLQMWAYLAAYKTPHDDEDAQVRRVHIDYPIVVDRALGLRRAADAAPAARAGAHRPGQRGAELADARQGARVDPLGVVHGAARLAGVHPRASPRTLPARGGDDLRGVRLGASVYWLAADRAALVRGRAQAGREAVTAREDVRRTHDGRVRRALLERRLGASLQCVRRQSPGCDALAALRHIPDGRAPARRGGTGRGRARLAPTPPRSGSRWSTWASTTSSTCSRARR